MNLGATEGFLLFTTMVTAAVAAAFTITGAIVAYAST